MDIDDLLEFVESLATDHKPEGWPAIQMQEVKALADEIKRQKATVHRLEEWIACIADDHPQIPDWIQQSARSLLAQEGE